MARSDIYLDRYGTRLPLATTLDRYQEIYRLPVAAFNGLYRTSDANMPCATIWQQTDRDQLYENLRLAQEQREAELGFPLAHTYIEEEYPYSNPLILKKKHLQQIGLETTTTIEAGVDISAQLVNDNITFTVTVDFTDVTQIHVYYPGETAEINPSSIRISGTTATIIIPKARLLKPEYNIDYNPADSDDLLLYEDTDLYLTTVDVKRIRYADNGGLTLVWYADLQCTTNPAETTQTAKGIISNSRLSIVNINPATYTSETAYTYSHFTKFRVPDVVRIRYVAGHTDARSELLTARLSHVQPNSMSPCEICWRDDVTPHPSKMTTPYGYTKAAIDAWLVDSRHKIGFGGMFGKS